MTQKLFSTLAFVACASLSSPALLADPGHHASIGEPGSAASVNRTVEIVLHDNYFEPENLAVSAGETIRFIVRNEGQLVHEFNIGTAAMHAAHQAEMQMMVQHGALKPQYIDHTAMEMDMGNGQTMAHDDPNSVLLEPGQTQELVWRFSGDGDLEFACNVPGHYAAGMVGELKVGS